MSVDIKTADIEDLETLCNIYTVGWQEAYKGICPSDYLNSITPERWRKEFARWINNDEAMFKILYCEDKPVGAIAYGHSREEDKPDYCEIRSIYFLPEYTGEGFGSLLLEDALKDLKLLGYKKCYLWVFDENKKAQEFYAKHGFTTREESGYYTTGTKEMYEHCIVKELSQN